ncbi:hypothetical protein EDB85DRAFT_1925561 [Lactarius pseudohatsudake]|nr:hypothetical protein EDB85DRAFT_1925561 [Lactarius pseudohatsudake]
MSTRNRGEVLSDAEIVKQLRQTIRESPSTEVAVLRLMEEFYFDMEVVMTYLAEQGLNVSFSDVEYDEDIASFVGLDHVLQFTDVTLFDLRRSRIPTTLFRDIVRDMDVLLIPYGNLRQHSNEETRSRFFAPIVNRLTALFGSWIRNTSESLMSDRITKRGRVEYYFKTFNAAVSVVLVEVTWNIGDGKERLNAIAQVIAECDACNWNNRKDSFNIPVYGILCDGCSFQFFTFDGNVTPSKFTMGTFPGSPFRGLKLVDFSSKPTARPFIHSLRPICETIFNLLLLTYIVSMKAFRDRFASQQKSLDGWDRALKFAEEALEMSQTAEVLRQEDSTVTADAIAAAAIKALKISMDAVPLSRKYINPPLMDSWDDDEVRRV